MSIHKLFNRQYYKKISLFAMKTRIFTLTLLFTFALSAIVFYSSCKKDREINVVITVKFAGDSSRVVPCAYVCISKYDVLVEGTTNAFGEFAYTFKSPAILDVVAEFDTVGSSLSAESVLLLEEGKEIRETLYLDK